jgi:hypothetical protein
MELVERLEPQVTAAREREAREDLPVGPRHPERVANALQALASTLPRGHVPLLLEEGSCRQERIRIAREGAELERLHHLARHVLQGPSGERRVRVVAERVHADQEQHVDLPVRRRLQDLAPALAPVGEVERSPDGLDLGAVLVVTDRPTTG